MKQKTDTHELDSVLEALANKHRRTIIYALSLQPHTISQLADKCKLTLPAIYKHITVLENAQMLLRKKTGQSNFLALNRTSLRSLQQWLMQYQTYWGSDKETLENYTAHLTDTKLMKGGEQKK